MQLEGLRRSRRSPNLTPLIDIVFLLLVFFMLTSHFVRDEAISIDLPQAQSAVSQDEETMVEVIINHQGDININGESVALDQLENKLRIILEGKEKRWVTLRGDQAANLGIAVNVLDAAKKAGAESVDIVTQQPAEFKP